MKTIRNSDLVEVPWKNGGGVTRDISSAAVNGKLIWRISMADVAHDGAFSEFSGLQRILTVIRGNGMVLESSHNVLQADPHKPVHFDGNTSVFARLKSGASTNLNVMFDPFYCDADVTVIKGPSQEFMTTEETKEVAVHCLSGTAHIDADHVLQPGDTAMLSRPAAMSLDTGDAVLLINIQHNTLNA